MTAFDAPKDVVQSNSQTLIKGTIPSPKRKSLGLISNSNPYVLKKPYPKDIIKLNNKTSKLDILDSHLTSFPLAPPPPKKDGLFNRSPEFNAIEDVNTTINSLAGEVDPIILVEDYIKRQKLARKKLSVLDLKISMKTFDNNDHGSNSTNYLTRCRSILSNNASTSTSRIISVSTNDTRVDDDAYLLTPYIVEEKESALDNFPTFLEHESTPIEHTNILESTSESILSVSFKTSINATSVATLKLLDDFDQPIPEFSLNNEKSLKYCIICESPLYDLSSLLNPSDKFNEFVCCGCTEKYEALSKLVDDFDQKMSQFDSENIQNIEEALNVTNFIKGKNSSLFSKSLVSKLQKQLNGDFSTEKIHIQKIWLEEAKKKLRWRWRLTGLLPKFLNRTIYGVSICD